MIDRGSIEFYKNALKSEIEIQPEISHEEYAVPDVGYGHGQSTWDPAGGDSWVPRQTVIDQPRVAIPDLARRDRAREQLAQFYGQTPSWRTKLELGFTLGYFPGRILKDIIHR